MCGQVPNGAAGRYLLGRICMQSNRHDAAVQHFTTALTLDPLLWCAYEELCALGTLTPLTEGDGQHPQGAVQTSPCVSSWHFSTHPLKAGLPKSHPSGIWSQQAT